MTNTRVVPIKNSVVMNMWDDMKQFKCRKTIGLARWMLLYKSSQFFVMNKRLNRGDGGRGPGQVHVQEGEHHG